MSTSCGIITVRRQNKFQMRGRTEQKKKAEYKSVDLQGIEDGDWRDAGDLPDVFELPHLDLNAFAPAFELGIVDLGLQLHEPVEIELVDTVGFHIRDYVDRTGYFGLRGQRLELLFDLTVALHVRIEVLEGVVGIVFAQGRCESGQACERR